MTRVGIIGYGNLGRGVEASIANSDDMELVAVFTRRSTDSISVQTKDVNVYHYNDILNHVEEIDVMILCGGSATDLPEMTPEIAKAFNVVDSFDTHANIPIHFEKVDAVAKQSGKTALISAGWDPGMFSLSRLYANAILNKGKNYTFWGRGVSQGHSDACRRVEGVEDARQYTIPVEEALMKVRVGENPELTTREKHTRLVYIVAKEGADQEKIAKEIIEMPNYFADYDTTVEFITREEMKQNHSGLPHGGSVIRTGVTGFQDEHKHVIEYNLQLDSNPEFTGAVLVAYARAIHRLNNENVVGCKTVFDIAPAYLINMSDEDMRAHLL